MRNFKLKLCGNELTIKLLTKRKTCPSCNGAGQVNVDDPDIKRDACDECGGSGSFDAFFTGCLKGESNVFFLRKFVSEDDFQKINLTVSLLNYRERSYDLGTYEDMPNFLEILELRKEVNNEHRKRNQS